VRLLCFDQFADLGGGQRSLLDLLPGFVGKGWSPVIVLPHEGTFSTELHRRNYETAHLRCDSYSNMHKPIGELLRFAGRLPALVHSLDRLVKRYSPTMLYVNGPRLLPAAAITARLRGLPVVFHCHNRLTQASAAALAGWAVRFSQAHVIACCRHVAHPLIPYVHRSRLSIIYNGVHGPDSVAAREVRPMRHIGVLGRVEVEKGQLEFVRAARMLTGEFPACSFSIVGAPLFSRSGYYNQVVLEAAGLPLNFPGWHNDVDQVFSSFDLLVVPSAQLEATTRVIPEAYSRAVPVVAFPSGGIPEILSDGETGFLAAGHTPEALAVRIRSVLRMSKPELETVLGNARAAWEAKYRIELYQDQVCAVLSQQLANRSPGFAADRTAAA
jgi:glycosyltransferase involved in cell wall biosynthesis